MAGDLQFFLRGFLIPGVLIRVNISLSVLVEVSCTDVSFLDLTVTLFCDNSLFVSKYPAECFIIIIFHV